MISEDSQPAKIHSSDEWGRRILAGTLATIFLLWLVVFPTLARWTRAPERLERYEKAGIDVSATFYTDLPMLLDPSHPDPLVPDSASHD